MRPRLDIKSNVSGCINPIKLTLRISAVRNSLWPKKKKKKNCEKRNLKMLLFSWFCYLKNTIGRKIKVNTKFLAILIRFLGTNCALPICLRWANGPIQLVHCDACSTRVKPRRSEVPRYLVSGEKYAVRGFTVTRTCMLNMCHSAHVVLAQRK